MKLKRGSFWPQIRKEELHIVVNTGRQAMGKLSSDRRPGRGDGCTFNHQSFYFCFYITCSPSNDRRLITNKHHAITDAFMEAIRLQPAGRRGPMGPVGRVETSGSMRIVYRSSFCCIIPRARSHCSMIPVPEHSRWQSKLTGVIIYADDGEPDIYNSRPLSTVPMYWWGDRENRQGELPTMRAHPSMCSPTNFLAHSSILVLFFILLDVSEHSCK